MSTETFVVPAISCAHCVAAITSEVAALAGVEGVTVDLERKVVTVTVSTDDGEGGGAGRDAIVAAIDEAGYDVAEP